jgi:cupin fold WbuC family metalloprotein
MDPIVWIQSGDQTIAIIIRNEFTAAETTFITPDNFNQQVGFVVYPAGGSIHPHAHLPIERHITGTAETLVVRKGRAEVMFYNDEKNLIATEPISQGDILILISGGHGLRILEDTVLLEVKQGPYTGLTEKEHFDDPGE